MPLGGNSKDQFVTSLAAMALYDGDAEISASQIKTLLAATNNTVAPYWPAMFSSFLSKPGKMEQIIFSGGAGGAAPAAAAASGPAPAAGDAPAAPAAKPKVEEVDALEGGMDMFGGGGSDY